MKKITKEKAGEIFQLIESGMSLTKSAEKAGVSRMGARTALKRYGYVIPPQANWGRASRIVDANRDRIESGEASLHLLARENQISQSALSTAGKKLGVQPKHRFMGRAPRINTPEKAQLVLDHLMEHGGYISHSLKALGMKMSQQYIRKYAKE